jgi:tRNA(Ser,Leu) C12 N-acetylase TAN1
LGVSALLTFASDPPPPRGTPEFLSRLLPVMRTCRATEEDIVTTVSALLEQSGLGGGSVSPKSVSKTALDPFFSPTTFAVKYEHHGPSLLDRKSLITRIEALILRSPDYARDEDDPQKAVCVHVYHDVALVSVVPDWKRLRGFSPFELASANARARGDAEPAPTTGQEGYP